MTATVEHTSERLTDQEEAILRSWRAGNDTRDIARAHKLDLGKVSGIIGRLCNYDRAIAALALEKGVRPQLPTPPSPARPHDATRRVPAEKPPAVPEPELEPVPAPQSEPTPVLVLAPTPEPELLAPAPAAATPVAPPPAGGIEHLLNRAEQLPGRARTLVARIRATVDELRQLIDRHTAEETARQLVAAKRRELKKAEAQLQALTRPARAPAAEHAVSDATIRVWAREAGVECSSAGYVPGRVREAYYAAHPGAPR